MVIPLKYIHTTFLKWYAMNLVAQILALAILPKNCDTNNVWADCSWLTNTPALDTGSRWHCKFKSQYVEHRRDPGVIGVDHPGFDPQGKQRHLGDRPSGDTMECCGGHNQYLPLGQHPVSRFTLRTTCRERHGGIKHGSKYRPRAFQSLPRPPLLLPSITRT